MNKKVINEIKNQTKKENKDGLVNNILEIVKNNIIDNNLIKNGDKIVVAVSGGPDSMCLLNTLYLLKNVIKEEFNIQYDFIVAHVNHMIRKESDDEKIYVENYCKKLNIPFFYLKENVVEMSKKIKMSEEACGRKIRYDFFEKVLQENNCTKIATAHNLNDDVETILLNIIRGCGLKGLNGMDFKYKNIIRPLVNIAKKDIMEYNILQNLNPCIDKTNFENKYVRNKIRNLLIPTLETEYNGNIVSNIIRMKTILQKDEDFLKKYTENVVKNSIIDNNISSVKFDFSIILKEHESIKYRAIRAIIELKLGNLDGIENIHVMDIFKLLENNIKGKKYIIGNKFTIEIVKKNIAIIY